MKQQVGTIKELWRYPVKSMVGEQVNHGRIEAFGLLGDRGWAIRDESIGELTVVRKMPKLLLCEAHYEEDPVTEPLPQVVIQLPNGTQVNSADPHINDQLSDYLQKDVSLWPLQPKRNWKHYRLAGVSGAKDMKKQFASKELPDMSSFSWRLLTELAVFATPLGRYYDCYPLHVLTTGALKKLKEIEPAGDFCVQRFRPNIVIDTESDNADFEEFSWIGGELSIGDTVIRCETRTVRCSMPSQPQSGIKKNGKVMRTVNNHAERHMGINATVVRVGDINVGDKVIWTPASHNSLQKAVNPVLGSIKTKMIHAMLKGVDKLPL